MRLVTFLREGFNPEAGVVRGAEVIGLSAAGYPDMLSLIAGGSGALAAVEEFCRRPPAASVSRSEVPGLTWGVDLGRARRSRSGGVWTPLG